MRPPRTSFDSAQRTFGLASSSRAKLDLLFKGQCLISPNKQTGRALLLEELLLHFAQLFFGR